MLYVTPWKKGQIIRQISSGKPYLVIHIYSIAENSSITECLDLETRDTPAPAYFLTQAHYDEWVLDTDMETRDGVQWKKHKVFIYE